jgi:hypothetical protein
MRILIRLGLVMAGAATLYLGWVLADRLIASRRAERSAGRPTGEVRITHFSASAGDLVEGEKATLCYGVVNARSVRMEPHVEDLAPSPNWCLPIAPRTDTRYTLTAEGLDGRRVTESFLVEVETERAPRLRQPGSMKLTPPAAHTTK